MQIADFNWDDDKNKRNIKKHRISFQEALSVFQDTNAILIPDESHSYYEERFLILGISAQSRLLIVCHCCREHNIIRIITARKANKFENKQYEGGAL
jgi:uncharacterized DUF497 family protein